MAGCKLSKQRRHKVSDFHLPVVYFTSQSTTTLNMWYLQCYLFFPALMSECQSKLSDKNKLLWFDGILFLPGFIKTRGKIGKFSIPKPTRTCTARSKVHKNENLIIIQKTDFF